MSMTPQEQNRMVALEKLVNELLNATNVQFIKNLERRLDFLSGTFQLSDASDVSATTPSSGQVLKYNGTAWAPGTDIDT